MSIMLHMLQNFPVRPFLRNHYSGHDTGSWLAGSVELKIGRIGPIGPIRPIFMRMFENYPQGPVPIKSRPYTDYTPPF